MRQKYLTEAEVLKAIEDEPELPGEPTTAQILRITEVFVMKDGKLDEKGIRTLLRGVVIVTKNNIKERIKKIAWTY